MQTIMRLNTSTWFKIFNGAAMQLCWGLTVWGASRNLPWAGPLCIAIYLAIHFSLVENKRRDAVFIGISALAGTLLESVQKISSLAVYNPGFPDIEWLAPLYITCLWMIFASTFYYSMSWLKEHVFLAAAAGAVFGPLSYITASKMGAISFTYPLIVTVTSFAIIWSLVMPLLARLSDRIK